MSATFQIRAADAADLGAVLAVERSSVGAPQWSEAVWRGLLQPAAGSEPLREVFVVVGAGRVSGFLVVVLGGDVAEIESVAVAEGLRRRGVGTSVCRHAMRWAAERGAARMELEVRSQSAGALAMYASLGFVVQGVRKGYYRQPEDDAVLMAADLSV